MAEYTGSSLYLAFKGTSLAAHYRTFTPSEAGDTVDASAGSDTHRSYLLTLLDGGASGEFVAQDGTAGTALWAAIAPSSVAGTLEWGPEGTATGKARRHVQAILTTRDENLGYADVTIWNVEWQYTAAPTYTVY